MIPWIRLAGAGAALLAAIALGWHIGGLQPKAALARLQAADAQAVAEAEAKVIEQGKRYAAQLQTAADQHSSDLLELSRVRAAAVPGILCHHAGSTHPLPVLPTASHPDPALSGVIPPAVEFDPSAALTALADRADDTVEACRSALARWPH